MLIFVLQNQKKGRITMQSDRKPTSNLIPIVLSPSNTSTHARNRSTTDNSRSSTEFSHNRAQTHLTSANYCQTICISADNIVPNRYQPRTSFSTASLARLSESIKRHGILQPITVRLVPGSEPPKYEIICGERRFRAGMMAGLTEFQCILTTHNDLAAAELSIIENLLRDDLNIFEQAEAFSLLANTFNMTQQQIADRVSLSQSAVANKIRLLQFSEIERSLILKYSLTERHARALLKLPDANIRQKFIQIIEKDKLNVAATEQLIENYIKYTTSPELDGKKPLKPSARSKKVLGIFKDVRIFSNSIEKAANVLRKSGVFVETAYSDSNDSYIYTIKISKAPLVSRET